MIPLYLINVVDRRAAQCHISNVLWKDVLNHPDLVVKCSHLFFSSCIWAWSCQSFKFHLSSRHCRPWDFTEPVEVKSWINPKQNGTEVKFELNKIHVVEVRILCGFTFHLICGSKKSNKVFFFVRISYIHNEYFQKIELPSWEEQLCRLCSQPERTSGVWLKYWLTYWCLNLTNPNQWKQRVQRKEALFDNVNQSSLNKRKFSVFMFL